jgi:D-beta-D-heptose 7-phosphate kinase/D-beta-D-heptose 1-phosphate adenosyltransferase
MEKLTKLIPQFERQSILVLGDVMVDKFVWGKVSRISPEAPVPVVEVSKETYALGGASNVANNLSSLLANVYLIGVIGRDMVGEQLKEDLQVKNINTDGLVNDGERPTIIKTRIIASHQQVVRVDKEVKGAFSAAVEKALLDKLEEIVPAVKAVIISDYGKGVINQTVLKRAISLALKYKIPVNVDPKIEHFLRYKKVSCITPNTSEAIAGMRHRDVFEDKDVVELGRKILKTLDSKSVLITRGEKGMTLFEPGDRITHIPTRAKEVFDVTGAGDTVIATFTLALAAKASFREAAEISNFAAGLVVGKLGTATVTPPELRNAILGYSKAGA